MYAPRSSDPLKSAALHLEPDPRIVRTRNSDFPVGSRFHDEVGPLSSGTRGGELVHDCELAVLRLDDPGFLGVLAAPERAPTKKHDATLAGGQDAIEQGDQATRLFVARKLERRGPRPSDDEPVRIVHRSAATVVCFELDGGRRG